MSSAPGTDADPVGVAGPMAVGTLLGGRYRLTARIGAGGMATIYRAADESLERDVAVKVLHAHLADDADLLGRFRAEARSAAALLHPNIVNVFDQGVAGLPYIVMEYIDGPSLRDVLVSSGRLTPGEALAVLEPVCRGLARAHAAGVVHRDIKPENILIAPDGTPKIADFGIARAVAATSHTATGTLIGSVHYVPPELVDGREATPASDQYATGIVLFELLTGRKPLPADSPMAVALRHAREAVPAPSRFAGDVPRALDRVVARATTATPDKRYPDMLTMAAALASAVPGGAAPLVVTPPGAEPDGDDDDGTLVIPAEARDTEVVTLDDGDGPRRAPLRPRRRPRRRARRATGVVAVVLLAAVAALAAWNWALAPVQAAPPLAGADLAEARRDLAELGVELVVAEEVHDVDAAPGTVIDQDPAAGEGVRRGGTVAVTVSLGPDDVTVPEVAGDTGADVLLRLAEEPYLFEVERRRVWSDDVPRGQVIRTDPAAGTTLQQGATVTVVVSRGVEQIEVPKVTGTSREEAVAALERAKLDVEITEKYSDKVPEPGTVISQSVPAGTTVDKGTTVDLTVSKGPVTFPMPDVRGDPIGDAVAALESMGLRVNVQSEPVPTLGPFRTDEPGYVEIQVPDPGTEVKRGDRVDLYTYE